MKFIRSRTTLAAVGAAAATAAAGGGISLAGAAASAPTSPGTAKVSVTLPSGVVKQRAAHAIACTVTGATYTVATTKSGARRRLNTKLTVTGYHGAGDYTGTATMTGHGPLGSFARTVKLPVTLTANGGTVTRTRTLKGRVNPANAGKSITRTLTWTCA